MRNGFHAQPHVKGAALTVSKKKTRALLARLEAMCMSNKYCEQSSLCGCNFKFMMEIEMT